MDNKLIAPKLCAWCHEAFTPRRPEQKCCPKPARCAYLLVGQQRIGQPPLAAIEKRRQMKGKVAEAALTERFGELTEREREIYHVGCRHGYNFGYATCYAPMKKRTSKRDAAA